ncbi:unnamed protein product, partial [Closterium sp. NIES-54]
LHTCLSPSYGPLTTLLLPDYLARSHSPHAYVAHLVCLKPTCNHEWTLRVLLREVPEIKLADKKGRPVAVNQSLVDRMGKVQVEKLLEAVRVVEGEEERAEAEEGGIVMEGEGHADSSAGEPDKEQVGGSAAVRGEAATAGGSDAMGAAAGASGRVMRRRLNEVGSGAEGQGTLPDIGAAIAAAAASQPHEGAAAAASHAAPALAGRALDAAESTGAAAAPLDPAALAAPSTAAPAVAAPAVAAPAAAAAAAAASTAEVAVPESPAAVAATAAAAPVSVAAAPAAAAAPSTTSVATTQFPTTTTRTTKTT